MTVLTVLQVSQVSLLERLEQLLSVINTGTADSVSLLALALAQACQRYCCVEQHGQVFEKV